LRDYQLAKALGQRADLTYVHFCSEAAMGDAYPFCARYIAVPRPKSYTVPKILRGVFGHWPLPIENYLSAQMSAALDDLASQGTSFDLIHVDSIQMAAYHSLLSARFPAAAIVYDFHNIESELMRRYGNNVTSLFKRFYASFTAGKIERVEHETLRRSLGVIVCSERERDVLAVQLPATRIAVAPNGVDADAFEPAPPTTARRRILFVGSMDYHANIDGALYLARELWPRVRELFPSWVLTIAGSNPTAEVRALGQLPQVEVTGTVPDLRPYYDEAIAAVAPVKTGGGTRLKILEAMAARVPVISTRLGAEGLSVTPGRELLLADTNDDWMGAFGMLQEEARWTALAQAGRDLVEARYDWKIIGRALYQTYADWLSHT
jgi:glycosyltransferase involved in cell wall biosynthesis